MCSCSVSSLSSLAASNIVTFGSLLGKSCLAYDISSDFDYEKIISQVNSTVGDNLETVFLISRPIYSHVSSTIVREIIKGGGDAGQFLPPEIKLGN